MKKGPFDLKSSKIVYKNPWISLREDQVVRPDGSDGIFGVIDYGGGVCILPVDKDLNVYVIKEYMYAIEKYEFELPSGGINKNEPPLEAAKRELFEETGLQSENFIDLGTANPLTMIMKSPFHMYLALNCTNVGHPEEGIEVSVKTWKDLITMVEDDVISHSGSLSTILKAKLYFEKNRL